MSKKASKASDRTKLSDAIGFYNPNMAKTLIRIGLILTFLYASVSALRTPDAWTGYIPSYLTKIVDAKYLLDAVAVLQLCLVFGLIIGRYLRLTAAVAAGLLLAIVFMNLNSLIITFRDLGLAFMALSLIYLD